MNWPDFVNATGGAIAAVLIAWQGYTSRKVRDLETRLKAVEEERNTFRNLLRAAIRHIRDWMAWERRGDGSPPPSLPDELRDEV